jgi:Tfp pilus assembly protein PilN
MSQQINLFDPALRVRRSPLSLTTMTVAVAGVLVAQLAFYFYASRELVRAESIRDRMAAQLKDLQAQAAKLGAPASAVPNKTLQDEVTRLEARLKARQEVADRLQGTGVGRTEGHSRFLEALARQHVDGVWLTDISVGESGSEFVIRGRVLSADLLPGYIKKLSQEDALRGRQIGDMSIGAKPSPDTAGKNAAAPRTPASGGDPKSLEFRIGSAPRSETGG